MGTTGLGRARPKDGRRSSERDEHLANDWAYRNENYPELARLRQVLEQSEQTVRSLTALRHDYILLARIKAEKEWDDANGMDLAARVKTAMDAKTECAAELTRIRQAESAELLPYPEGTIVEEMRFNRYGKQAMATGKKGVLQVFKAGDPIPASYTSYRVPAVGEIVVRVLKNNGEPGLGVCSLSGWSDWYKDGKMLSLKERKNP